MALTAGRQVSDHYRGDAGERYSQHYQADPYHQGYLIDYRYFQPFLRADQAVLDFGCGNGGILRLIATQVRQADGLEVNERSASIARALGLTVFTHLDELPSTACYDVVLSNHVLEHVRDVPATLERIRASMKKDGLILLKLPIDDWRSRDQRGWSRRGIDHHLHTWTPKLIGNVLYESGFDVENIRVITSAWHPKLFPLTKVGLAGLSFWALAVLKKRRQLFVVGNPAREVDRVIQEHL